jgi:hypothetical protein
MFLFPVKLFVVHEGWKSPVSSPLMRVCVGSGGFATVRAGDLRECKPSEVPGGSNRR